MPRTLTLPAAGLALLGAAAHAEPPPIDRIDTTLAVGEHRLPARVPEGYRLEILVPDLDRPRLITFHDNGDLFMGSRSGNVYRVPPPYTEASVVVQLDDYPHSVAFREGEMLIARTSGLYRTPYEPGQARIDPAEVSLVARLPGGSGHTSRTLRIGPDARVYVALGITGNCSDEYIDGSYPFEQRRGGVKVLDESTDPPTWQPFATGLRNPVGFDWHPVSGAMYASNNGPDHTGFDHPPEYFSRLDAGSWHGMPWYQYDGGTLHRDRCIRRDPPRAREEITLPDVLFPARNAPMDVAFVPEGGMHDTIVHDAVVALRGSWGTAPDGTAGGDPATRRHPKIVVVRFDDDRGVRVDDLVTGFQLEDGSRWARPVGVAIGPDGHLYFTSDAGLNGLYRLRREG